MFRISPPATHLRQRLLGATSSNTRSTSTNTSPIANQKDGNISNNAGSPSRPSKANNITNGKQIIHIDASDTGSRVDDVAVDHKIYTNKNGEKIMFKPCQPPPGYVFVRSGNLFITRSCRKITSQVYAVYRPESRKKAASQIGLYVPKEVFKTVQTDFDVRRAIAEQKLRQDLAKRYPKMPRADQDKIHHLVSSAYPTIVGQFSRFHTGITIDTYIRDRYTQFQSLDLRVEKDTEIKQAHEKARGILRSWCE